MRKGQEGSAKSWSNLVIFLSPKSCSTANLLLLWLPPVRELSSCLARVENGCPSVVPSVPHEKPSEKTLESMKINSNVVFSTAGVGVKENYRDNKEITENE